MEDLLTQHSERVAKSHGEHETNLRSVQSEAAKSMDSHLKVFHTAVSEATYIVSKACEALTDGLNSVVDKAIEESGAAFASNVAEIAGSSAAMQAEMRDRVNYLMRGVAPTVPAADSQKMLEEKGDDDV